MLLQFADTQVHIKDLQFGVVVERVYSNGERIFGHIEGFSRSSTDELVINVLVNGQHRIIHPANLIFNIKE